MVLNQFLLRNALHGLWHQVHMFWVPVRTKPRSGRALEIKVLMSMPQLKSRVGTERLTRAPDPGVAAAPKSQVWAPTSSFQPRTDTRFELILARLSGGLTSSRLAAGEIRFLSQDNDIILSSRLRFDLLKCVGIRPTVGGTSPLPSPTEGGAA